MYQQLWELMGTYFHEDFDGLESTTTEYLNESSDEDISTLVTDIDAFVASTPGPEVQRKLYELGSYVWLGEDPQRYIEWLRRIQEAAAARLQRANGNSGT